jgi:hypothetical protein
MDKVETVAPLPIETWGMKRTDLLKAAKEWACPHVTSLIHGGCSVRDAERRS